MEKVDEYRKIVQKILDAFTNIPFTVVVESTINKIIEPINLNNHKDKDLIGDIEVIANAILDEYFKNFITPNEYRKIRKRSTKTFRPNEVRILLEYIFPKKFREIKDKLKTITNVIHLKEMSR